MHIYIHIFIFIHIYLYFLCSRTDPITVWRHLDSYLQNIQKRIKKDDVTSYWLKLGKMQSFDINNNIFSWLLDYISITYG